MSVNSILKTSEIICQRKAFYRQRIPEFNCVTKETVEIDIQETPRNDDRKIIHSIRITSTPLSRISGTRGASSDEHLPKQYL